VQQPEREQAFFDERLGCFGEYVLEMCRVIRKRLVEWPEDGQIGIIRCPRAADSPAIRWVDQLHSYLQHQAIGNELVVDQGYFQNVGAFRPVWGKVVRRGIAVFVPGPNRR
jgi:hypothetical protein